MNLGDETGIESTVSLTQAIDISQDDDQKSELCNMCKDTPNFATHECLACQAFCCMSCGKDHCKQQRFAHHRLVQLNACALCPKHNQELILYCFECMKLCCLVCGHFSPEHFGHKLLDIESAYEELEPVIDELQSKLENVKSALNNKEEIYLHEKADINKQIGNLKDSLTNAVRELTKAVNSELETHLAELDSISSEKLLRLDFELSKTQDLKSQIDKMSLPLLPRDRLLLFLPQARNLIGVPIHPPEEFYLDPKQMDACRNFLVRTESALEAAQGKLMVVSQENVGKRQFGRCINMNEMDRNPGKIKTKEKKKETVTDRTKRNRKKTCLADY